MVLGYMFYNCKQNNMTCTVLRNDNKIQNMWHFIAFLIVPFNITSIKPLFCPALLFFIDTIPNILLFFPLLTGIRDPLICMSMYARILRG